MVSVHKPRVRFAPSPTGNLHVGGMRTALFNWLFARHHDGAFLLRSEDTDLVRSRREYVDAQLSALRWCGIESDEPLVFQSQRMEAYQAVLEKLFADHTIYRCVCTPEELETRAAQKGNTDQFSGYDSFCRTRAIGDDCGKPFVIRFALPETVKEIVVDDLIRGKVTFDRSQLDDFIIIRSDGSPTYNFVVVVDDVFMRITHVIRADEHLPNTPKQLLLYQACGWTPPLFAHIPLICNMEGQPLSKRDGAVDVLQYQKDGYLADALVNYCVRLGWAHGDQEIFTKQELINYFTLDGVGKKPAAFDIQKLQWVNGLYIKQLNGKQCYEWLVSDVDQQLSQKLSGWPLETIYAALELYKERVKTGKELIEMVRALYDGPRQYHKADIQQWMTPQAGNLLQLLVSQFEKLKEFSSSDLSAHIKALCKEQGIGLVTVAQPLRIALTGAAQSPGVFELLALVGKQESIKRVRALLHFLS